jgi:hypothetical protein
MSQGLDPELDAMQTLLAALAELNDDARARVLGWVASRYEINLAAKPTRKAMAIAPDDEQAAAEVQAPQALTGFQNFGELFAAAEPKTNGEKALVAGFWLQTRGDAAELTGQAINTELKHLGHGVPNITAALEELKAMKPALAMQLRKAGSSQQARKKYKVTEAGAKHVEAMVREAAE